MLSHSVGCYKLDVCGVRLVCAAQILLSAAEPLQLQRLQAGIHHSMTGAARRPLASLNSNVPRVSPPSTVPMRCCATHSSQLQSQCAGMNFGSSCAARRLYASCSDCAQGAMAPGKRKASAMEGPGMSAISSMSCGSLGATATSGPASQRRQVQRQAPRTPRKRTWSRNLGHVLQR